MTTMAARISKGCCWFDSCAARAVPWKLPRTLIGMWMEASAARTAAWLSASVAPSARLYEMVVASSESWWLTEVAVGRSLKLAMADKGTMGVALELTAAPVDASRSDRLAEVPVVAAVVDVPLLPVLLLAVLETVAVARAGTYTSF